MRRTFLTLVRSGLWNTPVDPTPFSSMNSADWEEIYQLARTQALLAITFDGVPDGEWLQEQIWER